MSKPTRAHVFDAMELLPAGLTPFVEKCLKSAFPGPGEWQKEVASRLHIQPEADGNITWDQHTLLKIMERCWHDAFSTALGRAERTYVNELMDVRNKLAHNKNFSYDDAERALDTMRRLLEAASAGAPAKQIATARNEILRIKYDELARNEGRRKTSRVEPGVETAAGLLPWKQVIEPHADVASGNFRQAEFAADLIQVRDGTAQDEYANPRDFFARTYLTEGLKNLLVGAAHRLNDDDTGGDPVVELQTNFGGGKTHAMIALYHMAGDTPAADLPGLDQLLAEHKTSVPQGIRRAVLVGTARGPLESLDTPDGLKIRTLWGELAWRLGGAEAFDMLAENDAKSTAPGSKLLTDIFTRYSPCLILIDEWVAYLRHIYKADGLLSGSFDTNLSFVQSLTEAVKSSPATLLLAALPKSEIEVGGEGGQEALARLKQTFSRLESPWRPASQEESYEIVRRRLFKDIPGDKFQHRDNAVKQFQKLYRDRSDDFPRECNGDDYKRKLQKSYPIHPQFFDNLYTAWGSLEQFQRTRGVLRFMAQLTHELWMRTDNSVMIMPACVPLDSNRVEPELMRYLGDNWRAIISKDVDGDGSVPHQVDSDTPNLNRCAATRRVARAIFMATAPLHKEKNRGINDKHIHLATIQPGETATTFGDALRRLANQATFLHSDMGYYFYSTSPSLNRLASDRAEEFDDEEIIRALNEDLKRHYHGLAKKDRGEFETLQAAPADSSDIPDEPEGLRLIVMGVNHPHSKNDSQAQKAALDILTRRGTGPREYRNCLVFLAADHRQLVELKSSMRNKRAWEGIISDAKLLDLTKSNEERARQSLEKADKALDIHRKETWCHLLCPLQKKPEDEISWSCTKLSTQEEILPAAGKRLLSDEALLVSLGPARLQRDLKEYMWHDKPHISLQKLWQDLNKFIYLPRLKRQQVLQKTVSTAISTAHPGAFAYAQGWDEEKQIYIGLAVTESDKGKIVIDSEALLVSADVAQKQLLLRQPAGTQAAAGAAGEQASTANAAAGTTTEGTAAAGGAAGADAGKPSPTRFLGAVSLSSQRPSKDFSNIVEGIIERLSTIPGSKVNLKLEIDAEIPSGLDSSQIRTLNENAKTLAFFDKKIE